MKTTIHKGASKDYQTQGLGAKITTIWPQRDKEMLGEIFGELEMESLAETQQRRRRAGLRWKLSPSHYVM